MSKEMMSMNISVPAAMLKWIKHQQHLLGYASTSEYIRDLVREEMRKSMAKGTEEKS